MGIFGIEKVDNSKNNTFIDNSATNKQPEKVDNLAEMERIVLEKKAYEDLKKAQIEEAKRVQEVVEQQKQNDIVAQQKVEEAYINSLDPLNNASNPVPVNPVAPQEEKVKKESLGIGGIIKMVFGMVFHPGDVLDKKPDKYGTIGNGIKLTLILTILTVALSLAGRVISGMFVKDYNSITGAYKTSFDINNALSAVLEYYSNDGDKYDK